MKRRTIQNILRQKLKAWANTVDDKEVKRIILKETVITGGCIASMLLNEPVNDYDVYIRNRGACKILAEYYINKFNKDNGADVALVCKNKQIKPTVPSSGVAKETDMSFDLMTAEEASLETPTEIEDEGEPYRPIFITSNAITLANDVQIVVRFYGKPQEIHKNFDFVHCTSYYDSQTSQLVLPPQALEALLTKELVYVGSKFPICSIIRTRKFIRRGYTISAGQYLKMCFQLSMLDLQDIEVLENQLVGVDTTYFLMLISAMKRKKDYDLQYVTELVDKLN